MLKQGMFVKTSEPLQPFYSDYAGNPNIIVPKDAIGIVMNPKCLHGGDIIIDFPIDTSDLKVTEGYEDRKLETVWRVRLTKEEAKRVLVYTETLEWLKFTIFCGSLILDCELPKMFNREVKNEN